MSSPQCEAVIEPCPKKTYRLLSFLIFTSACQWQSRQGGAGINNFKEMKVV